jgi:cation transport ATPase
MNDEAPFADLARCDYMVLDKTGTITDAELTVEFIKFGNQKYSIN